MNIQLETEKEYTGAQIKAAGVGPLIKLTNESEVHNGFAFHTGENIDTVPFSPSGTCSPGGIYFCEMKNAPEYFHYNGSAMKFYRSVTLSDDARVYVEDKKMKADKVTLGERQEIFASADLFNSLLYANDDISAFIKKKPTLLTQEAFDALPLSSRTLFYILDHRDSNNHWKHLTFNQAIHDKAWAIGFDTKHSSASRMTRELLLQVINSTVGFAVDNLCERFPSSLFDDEIYTKLIRAALTSKTSRANAERAPCSTR